MRTFRLPKKLAVAFLVAGGVMVVSPLTAAVAQTSADGAPAEVGAFDAVGDSNGIGALFGNPNSSPYPVATALVPYSASSLTAGPSGRALSSINWPGPLAANAGSLANVIGTPLPPALVANANYPVKAEANAGGGGRDEQTVGPMRAVVDGNQAQALSAISDFSTPAFVSAARVATESRSFLEDGLAIVEAESVLEDVEVAGLLRFDNVRTFVRAESDGITAKVEHEMVVSGATVNGQPAEISDDGLVVNGEANENPAVEAITGANQGLQQSGMQAYLTDPYEEQTGPGSAQVSSGSLVIVWKLGEGGDQIIATLGGSSAHVSATTGGFGGLDEVGGGDTFTPIGGDSFSPPTGSFDTGAGSLPVADIPTGGSQITGSPEAFTPVTPFDLASATTDRLPIGWMLIGIAGMFLLGMGLNGLRAAAIAATLGGTTCPLERSA